MTERLYYADSHLYRFSATVTGCEKTEKGFLVTLDRSAFFPEGGGQKGDRGTVGGVPVLDTQEAVGEVYHLTTSPIAVGAAVECELDWGLRFSRMQSHSGEHIVSGIVHNLYGFENVGFHMGEDMTMTVDFSGFLDDFQLLDVERMANRVIWENRRVTATFPSPEELSAMTYRSKLELTENVRIVEIDGVDKCACCAPHVSYTGEVGLIRILDAIRRKDGVRILMQAGETAYLNAVETARALRSASRLLSAKQEAVPAAIEQLLEERSALSYRLGGMRRAEIASIAENTPETDGNITVFRPDYTVDDLRLLANALLPRCGGIVGAFSGEDGAYKYILASKTVDLRAASRAINAALSGRGGGQPGMIQGTFSAGAVEIKAFFERYGNENS